MPCKPRGVGPSEAVLLARFDNHSQNIEYTKNRSYALIVGYSAVCAFLIDKLDKLMPSNFYLQAIFIVLFIIQSAFCWSVILDNYDRIKKRREYIKNLKFYGVPKNDDWPIPIMQILYLFTVFVLTLNKISSHITL